ncbi:MAG: hypothetical protein GY876_03530 [Planctomycetes bacterium]|nr:hypothetical protein [Planctomycetota bacterium]MCP4887096.1 hypothetical protein [Planctomycetaceae bacterium]
MNRSTLEASLIVLRESAKSANSRVHLYDIRSAIADIEDIMRSQDDSTDIKTLELEEN